MSQPAIVTTHFRHTPAQAESGDVAGTFYHPELDALRFFAFLGVFFHHALPRDITFYVDAGLPAEAARWLLAAKTAGAYGVDLFFALSAYLITELLIREHMKRGAISVRAFYVRRALRIWPLYFGFLAAAVLLVPRILPDEDLSRGYALSFALFAGNWTSAAWGLPFSVAGPLWSVSIEEQFYLTWPLLLVCFGTGRVRHLAVVMIAVAWATRVVLVAAGAEYQAIYFNTFARLDPIACGALIAVGLRGRSPNLNTASRLALCCGGLLVLVLVGRYLPHEGPGSLVTYPAVAAGSVMLLLAALRAEARFLKRAPLSGLVYLGRISYGLYVFHLFALTFMAKQLVIPLLGVRLNFELRLVCSLLLTLLLAAASYRWLEQPFLRLKRRFTYVASGAGAETDQSGPEQAEDGVVALGGESRA